MPTPSTCIPSLSDEAREIVTASIRNTYEEFITRVAEARDQSVDDIDNIAQGQVWSGYDAHKLGLVDQLGTLSQAIQAAADRGGIGDEYGVRYIERELSFSEALAMRFAGKAQAMLRRLGVTFDGLLPLRGTLGYLRYELKELMSVRDPLKVYSYCFCSVD